MPGPVSTWMGDRLWAGKPISVCNQPPRSTQPFIPPVRVGKSSTSLHWLWLGRGVFACVGWQVILCDPIWQKTPRSSEIDFHKNLSLLLSIWNSDVCRIPWQQ